MNLQAEYKKFRPQIKKRLAEFKRNKNYERLPPHRRCGPVLFMELCFCLCTPQSSARKSHKAVQRIRKDYSQRRIAKILKECGVRFHNNKAKYIMEARKKKIVLEREWLVENIKGIGMKEASHFLRNVGQGNNFAILDRHILKNLKRFGVIKQIPKTISKKKYIEIEEKMRKFSKKVNIPMAELDLLLWAMETGEVFK